MNKCSLSGKRSRGRRHAAAGIMSFAGLVSILAILTIVVGCPALQARKAESQIDKIVSGLTLEDKIGQLMMFGIPGKADNQITRNLIKQYRPGGVLLFGFNVGSAQELGSYMSAIQNNAVESGVLPLFVSIDQEGGRVVRVVDGVTQFPGAMAMGSANDPELVRDASQILGMQLRRLGVNMNLTPDVDVNNNPDNPVINTRSFGSDPLIVSAMGRAMAEGQRQAWCISVAKHFPGHGDTGVDSHKALPVITYDLERLRKVEFVPFKAVIESGVEGVMSAHISYPAILGNDRAATLSRKFMHEILRQELGFNGITMTDDLEMNAIAGNISLGQAAVEAFNAGVDVMLLSTSGQNVAAIYSGLLDACRSGKIDQARLDESVRRIVSLKLSSRIMNIDETGKIYPLTPAYDSDEEKALLARADEINASLCEKSLYFYRSNKKTESPARPQDHTALVVTDSNVLWAMIQEQKTDNNWILASPAAAYAEIATRAANGKSGQLTVYYAPWQVNRYALEQLLRLSKQYGFNLIAVSINNPFELTALGELPPSLFTYSFSAGSLRAAARAMVGKIAVNTDTVINHGFGRNAR